MIKRIGILLIAIVFFFGLSMWQFTDASWAAGSICDITITYPGGTETIECNGEPDLGTVYIAPKSAGNITLSCNNGAVTYFNSSGVETVSYGGTEQSENAKVDWVYGGQQGTSIFNVQIEALPPPFTEIKVNGNSASYKGYIEDIYYYIASISSKNGTIYVNMPGSQGTIGTESVGGDVSRDESASPYTFIYSNLEAEHLRIYFYIQNTKAILDLTYSTSSGGSNSESLTEIKDSVNVINKTNSANDSSDTILTPANTKENNGASTTEVTSKEVEALINLAEAHKDDVDEGENEAIINVNKLTANEINRYEINVSAEDAEKLSHSIVDMLAVNTPIGNFRIRSEELNSITTSYGGDLKFKLGSIYNSGRPGIDAVLVKGDTRVTTFEDNYCVEIRIPYEAKKDEDLSSLYIEYLKEDGTKEIVTESKYDVEHKWLSFFPTHLSKYGVAYNPVIFKDITSKYWASSYITYLASRKVINGKGDGRFYPDTRVSKAEFINMMTKAFSAAALGKKTIKSYKDVPIEEWYARAIGWSYMNNISNVLARNGRFYPEQNLTREDMATLVNNISLGLKIRLKESNQFSGFSDMSTVSPYAKNGIERMTKCKIISGAGGGRFLPKQGITRAEAAKVISTLMSKMK